MSVRDILKNVGNQKVNYAIRSFCRGYVFKWTTT